MASFSADDWVDAAYRRFNEGGLAADEALALVVALRSLAEIPGLGNGDAVRRALAKVLL